MYCGALCCRHCCSNSITTCFDLLQFFTFFVRPILIVVRALFIGLYGDNGILPAKLVLQEGQYTTLVPCTLYKINTFSAN